MRPIVVDPGGGPLGRSLRVISLCWLLAGCGAAELPSRPSVVVSVLPQAYVVERLVGEGVELHLMIPPGANEATFEPTVEQLQAVSRALLYLKVGHPHFAWEAAWLDRLLSTNRSLRVVDGSRGCPLLPEDPHVWLSPSCVEAMASGVAAALAELLPEQAPTVAASLGTFREEIAALDAEIRTILAPFHGRAFLVFHPAWGYFAREYGLRQIAIQRGSLEPGTREVAEVVRQAREEGMHTVFVQPQFSSQSAELVAREIGGSVVALDPLARDWPSSLRRAARAIAESFR